MKISRHITIVGLLSILFILSTSIVQATYKQVLVSNAFFADQMPAGAQLYASIRTDDAYIDELDSIFQLILGTFATRVLATPETQFLTDLNLRQPLDMLARDFGGDFETVFRSWLGDSAAMGIYFGEERPEHVLIIIDHTNREALADFIAQNLPFTPTTEGNFTLYATPLNLFIAFDDETLYISSRQELLPLAGTPRDVLADSPRFQQAIGALPAISYNIFMAGDTGAIAQLLDGSRPATRRNLQMLLPESYTAIGATIVDGVSPTIDIVQLGLPNDVLNLINAPLDPSFAQHIPQNATAVIHATNLDTIYQTLIDFVAMSTGQDLQAQLNQSQAIFGVDIPSLLFSGDFATYLTYKPEGFVQTLTAVIDSLDIGASEVFFFPAIEQLVDLGFVFQISDPTQAQNFITQLGMLFNMAGGNMQGVTATIEEIAGNTALVIATDIPGSGELKMIIGANDAVLVIGTYDSAVAILSGNDGFDSSLSYQNSLRYSLSNSTHYWFLDRNGVVASLDVLYLNIAMGPVIGDVFEDIISNLSNPPTTLTPEEIARREEERRQRLRREFSSIIETQGGRIAFAEIFDSASIALSSKEGILFVRMVITLDQ